jgi:hypothetical protein
MQDRGRPKQWQYTLKSFDHDQFSKLLIGDRRLFSMMAQFSEENLREMLRPNQSGFWTPADHPGWLYVTFAAICAASKISLLRQTCRV